MTQGLVKAQVRKTWKHINFVCSSSTCKSKTWYQPGGTCSIIRGKWVSRVSEAYQDKTCMGRWTVTVVKGKGTNKVAIINAYRVGARSPKSAGAKTATHQQWTVLRAKGVQNPNPRQQFIDDLIEVIKELQTAEHEIVLGLDANEPMGKFNSKIAKLAEITNLIDIHNQHHSIEHGEPPGTHKRGTEKIDHILVSPRVAETIDRCGIDAFNTVIHSDHRGSFIDFNMGQILKGTPEELGALPKRGINGKDPRRIEPYRVALYKQLDNHNILHRARQLVRLYDRKIEEPRDKHSTKPSTASTKTLPEGCSMQKKYARWRRNSKRPRISHAKDKR